MLQRIWRKNAINFPTLFHFNVGKIYRNAYGEKNAIHFQHFFILKLEKYVAYAYGEKMQ